jgi:hypothetical protein
LIEFSKKYGWSLPEYIHERSTFKGCYSRRFLCRALFIFGFDTVAVSLRSTLLQELNLRELYVWESSAWVRALKPNNEPFKGLEKKEHP